MPKKRRRCVALIIALSVFLQAGRVGRSAADVTPALSIAPGSASHFSGLTIYARPRPPTDKKPPTVVISGTTVGPSWPLDEAVLRRIFIRQSLEALRGCYLRALQDAPTLTGVVAVRFGIAKNGHIESAEVATALSASLDGCVVAEVKKTTFPAIPGGPLNVTYPFAFKLEAL